MKLCGFVHSIFVRTPTNVIGLFASYSAPNEWCANNGVTEIKARQKMAKIGLAMGHLGWLSVEHIHGYSQIRSRASSGDAIAARVFIFHPRFERAPNLV